MRPDHERNASARQAPTHVDRYLQVAAAFRRHGLGFAVGLLGLDRVIGRRRGGALGAASTVSAESPAHLRAALEELGPTFIKLGRLLSTRSDLLPPAFVVELAKLQDAAPPVPVEEIRAVIRTELGAEPEELFASFDDRPLASASIGQAHAATLTDGTRVVVKVRRPGAVSQVQLDLISGIGGLVAGERRWRSWEGTPMGAGLGAIGALGTYLAWTAKRRRPR